MKTRDSWDSWCIVGWGSPKDLEDVDGRLYAYVSAILSWDASHSGGRVEPEHHFDHVMARLFNANAFPNMSSDDLALGVSRAIEEINNLQSPTKRA